MSPPLDPIADCARRLDALAELTLEVAGHVAGTLKAARDPDQVARLSRAYATVGRCLRMTCALSMRLAQGPAEAGASERDAEALLEDAPDRMDHADRPERIERPGRIDREDLYDRLPPGGLPDQITAVARRLATALQVLPDNGAAAHARCEAITGVVLPLARPAPVVLLRPRPQPPRPAGQVLVLTRPRAPPA